MSLPTLSREIAATIAANEAARFDATKEGRAACFILAGLTQQLRRHLAALDHDIALPLAGPFGTTGRWQTRERKVRDLMRRSEIERRDASAHPAPTRQIEELVG